MTKIAEKVNDKWNNLKMMPNELLKDFFSRVDSIISEFQIKCQIIKTDAEIFSRVQTQLPFHIVKIIKASKRTAGKNSSWEEVKKDVVDAYADEEKAMINAMTDGGMNGHEAYAVGVETRECNYCHKVGHIKRFCPLLKNKPWRPKFSPEEKTHYEPEKKEEPEKREEPKKIVRERPYGVNMCILCNLPGHLAPSCPRHRRAPWDV